MQLETSSTHPNAMSLIRKYNLESVNIAMNEIYQLSF